MLCRSFLYFDSHETIVVECLLSSNSARGGTQNIRQYLPGGLTIYSKDRIMVSCGHECAVGENEVLTARLVQDKSLRNHWLCWFPMWVGVIALITHSLQVGLALPHVWCFLWCVQVSIKIETPNPHFWKSGFKSGLQYRRKTLVTVSQTLLFQTGPRGK